MKLLLCDECGGKELLKMDGLYVCQSCGSKYIEEDIKKFSNMIDNFKDLAVFELETFNYASAKEYAIRILELDSKDDLGWFLRAISTNIEKLSISEYINLISKCLENANKENLDSKLIVYFENSFKDNMLNYINRFEELIVVTDESHLNVQTLNVILKETNEEIDKLISSTDDFDLDIYISLSLILFEISNIFINSLESYYETLYDDFIVSDESDESNSIQIDNNDYINKLKVPVNCILTSIDYYLKGINLLYNLATESEFSEFEIHNIGKNISELTSRIKSTIQRIIFDSFITTESSTNFKLVLIEEIRLSKFFSENQVIEMKSIFNEIIFIEDLLT